MEPHVDIEFLDEAVCEQEAAFVLQVILDAFVVVVEPIALALWSGGFDAIDNGTLLTAAGRATVSRQVGLPRALAYEQVDMERLQNQARIRHSEDRLISSPASRARRSRLEIEE